MNSYSLKISIIVFSNQFSATAPRGHHPHHVPVASSPTTNLLGVGSTAEIIVEEASLEGTLSGPNPLTLEIVALLYLNLQLIQ